MLTPNSPSTTALTAIYWATDVVKTRDTPNTIVWIRFILTEQYINASASSSIALRHSTRDNKYGLIEKNPVRNVDNTTIDARRRMLNQCCVCDCHLANEFCKASTSVSPPSSMHPFASSTAYGGKSTILRFSHASRCPVRTCEQGALLFEGMAKPTTSSGYHRDTALSRHHQSSLTQLPRERQPQHDFEGRL